jgi:hypothetical protein
LLHCPIHVMLTDPSHFFYYRHAIGAQVL